MKEEYHILFGDSILRFPNDNLMQMSEEQRIFWRKKRAELAQKEAQMVTAGGTYNFTLALLHAQRWGLVVG